MQIEIFSDVVCPWCYIGKRQLDAALAREPDADLQLRWRPFQLYPQLPEGGVPRKQFMAARFGAGAAVDEIYERVLAEAREVGLYLDFSRIDVAPNTFLAHRLLSWAESTPHQHELAEVLFRFYFVEGRDVGDIAQLALAAGEAGLDASEAAAMLATRDEADKVLAELQLGEAAGVTGVPFFVLGGRFGIPGAQPADVMSRLISRARSRLAQPQV